MKLHSVSRSSGGGGGGSRTLADGLDSAVYTILSQYSRRQCRRRRLLLASLVAMVYTVWWLLLLIPTVVVYMYYWVYRRRCCGGAHGGATHRCTTDEAAAAVAGAAGTARAFPPPPPLFRFCVWPTRRIETGGRCDSILDGTVALLAFAGMVVSSWLTLSTSNSASSIFKLRKRSFGRLLKQQNERPFSALSANQVTIPTSVSQLNPSLSVLNLSMNLSHQPCLFFKHV